MMDTQARKAEGSSYKDAGVDMVLLNDLYEEIENRPPAIEARRLLAQHCLSAGWEDAARDAVKGLLRLLPADNEALAWAMALEIDAHENTTKVEELEQDPPAVAHEDIEMAKVELIQGYQNLMLDSKRLRREIAQIRKLAYLHHTPISKTTINRLDDQWRNLNKLSSGKVSSVLRGQQLRSTRSVARDMEASPSRAVELAIADLEEFALWLRSPAQPSPIDDDALREAFLGRIQIIATALPERLKRLPKVALMHAEHEIVRRKYVNDETMYGDEVKDIPRDNFLVTDDGYAWDMEELSQAITSGGGVMRNPLSKQMFTPTDIRTIVQHPLGANLQALSLKQSKLSRGFRPKTIEEMEKMADILLADMSDDQMASRQAVDAFLAYAATLPEQEQKALEGLRVPAKDTHTGQAFDCTITEAVLDAQGNRVCFHKTGDFIRQAAAYLKGSSKLTDRSGIF